MRYYRPLPNLNDFKLFFSLICKKKVFKSYDLYSKNKISFLFERSRYSLLSLYKSVEKTNKKKTILWIPNFFCWEIAKFLEINNVNINFYELNSDLSPNLDFLNKNELNKNSSKHLFLLVKFFGIDFDFNQIRIFNKE